MNLQKFENDLFELVVKAENGENLFDAETVARSLGITTVAKSGNVTIRWKRFNDYLGVKSQQISKGDFISEPMVYKLAFKANNETAEKFQEWLAVDVLPSIRKHGMYAKEELLDNPDLLLDVVSKLKEERTGRLVAEQRVNELQPKADYYDNILNNQGLVTISKISKNYGMSAVKFNQLLHDLGVQFNQSGTWLLYSKHQAKGYTHIEPFDYTDANGNQQVKTRMKWTQKGHIFIYELLKKNGILPMIEINDIA